MERVIGNDPISLVWKTRAQPLYQTRKLLIEAYPSVILLVSTSRELRDLVITTRYTSISNLTNLFGR